MNIILYICIMAKKQQATSQLLTCDICGKKVYARGLKSHVRLQHKLELSTQVVTQVVTKEYIAPETKKGAKQKKTTGILFNETVDLQQDENTMLMGFVGVPPKSAWERKVEAANLKASNHKFLEYIKKNHPDKYENYYKLLKS